MSEEMEYLRGKIDVLEIAISVSIGLVAVPMRRVPQNLADRVIDVLSELKSSKALIGKGTSAERARGINDTLNFLFNRFDATEQERTIIRRMMGAQ